MRRMLVFIAGCVAFAAVAADTPRRRPTDLSRGAELYTRHCVACHGEDAAGGGPLAASLKATVPDLSERVVAGNREELARLLIRGSGAMPSFETSFDKPEAMKIIAYLERELGGGGAVPPPMAVEVEEETDGAGGDARPQ